ncbi:MAG: hypothetical protein H0T51_25090 [Pirellulales bacterium]|nr:hypothetical protein [Pirellulales bacterium]
MADKPDQSADYIQRLLDAEEISPTLRSSYQSELDAMLAPALTPRKAASGVTLLVILLVGVAALLHNLFVVEAEPLVTVGWLALLAGFGGAAFLVARDLWLKKHSKKSQFAVTYLICGAAGMLAVVTMLRGMSEPADPASTFHVLFALVFYIACLFWNLDSRIAAAELAAREQMLRIEIRLADLAERLRS